MAQTNLLIAFSAGMLGFFAPCVLPLIPGYLAFLTGVSLEELTGPERRQHSARVLLATGTFVLGFSIIFVGLGASASLFGAFVLNNRLLLSRVGGVIVVLLGLSMLGAIRIPGFAQERRFHMTRRPLTIFGAFPVGMAFGFAWTPCVGPVLGAVLTLAATTQSAAAGARLLFAYSLGLGVPFLVTAVVLTRAFEVLRAVQRHARTIEVFGGVFLVGMGAALIFDLVFQFNAWVLQILPVRALL
jgi:cytochrome c-type biogenesis protein